MNRLEALRLPQDSDTPLLTWHRTTFSFRYAYARSADTRSARDVGQDYLVCQPDEQMFLFALCDGVSESFLGDLAARFLGDALVTWLADSIEPSHNEAVIQSDLTRFLFDLVEEATALVDDYSLPDTIPPLVRHVLEEKRRESGSQSTFVCGRIDQASATFPQGRVVLAWMGDSRLRIWGVDGERSAELNGSFDSSHLWSTLQGPINSEPSVFIGSLVYETEPAITHLAAYSDGLAVLDRYPSLPPDEIIQELVEATGESATSDDISFLEVWSATVPSKEAAFSDMEPGPSSEVHPPESGAQDGVPSAEQPVATGEGPHKAPRSCRRKGLQSIVLTVLLGSIIVTMVRALSVPKKSLFHNLLFGPNPTGSEKCQGGVRPNRRL